MNVANSLRAGLMVCLMAAALAACSTCEVAGVQMQENRATGKMVFTGPFEQRDNSCYAGGDGDRLRSLIGRDGSAVHWVDTRMEWTGSGASYWVGARDNRSDRQLTLGPALRRTGECSRVFAWGCEHQEEVGAMVPDDILRAAAIDDDGLSIRFQRHSGFWSTARFSREQVKAHMESIDAWVKRLGAAKP
jgi:hypothetical protein